MLLHARAMHLPFCLLFIARAATFYWLNEYSSRKHAASARHVSSVEYAGQFRVPC